jgi:hypothetical protein
VLQISLATAERHWTYARTWLVAEFKDRGHSENPGKNLQATEGFGADSSH